MVVTVQPHERKNPLGDECSNSAITDTQCSLIAQASIFPKIHMITQWTHSSSTFVWSEEINITLKHFDHVYELVGKVSEFWKNFLVPFNPSFLPNRRHLVHNLSSHKQSQKQLPSFSKILGGHTYKGGEKAPLLGLWKILHHFFPTFCEVIGVPCCCGQCLKYP